MKLLLLLPLLLLLSREERAVAKRIRRKHARSLRLESELDWDSLLLQAISPPTPPKVYFPPIWRVMTEVPVCTAFNLAFLGVPEHCKLFHKYKLFVNVPLIAATVVFVVPLPQ